MGATVLGQFGAAVALALTVSTSTAAQDAQDTTRLKELVVTATRTPIFSRRGRLFDYHCQRG
jgi:hypothetical protein